MALCIASARLRPRDIWQGAARYLALTFAIGILAIATPATAAGTKIIRADNGGPVAERVNLVQEYRSNGTRVEIVGPYCLSSCTLYLGLPDICVAAATVFGFHGPSSKIYGVALRPPVFDTWSRIMADHYPEPLRAWFWDVGRHRIVGFHYVSGSDLIDIGLPNCSQPTTG